MNIYTMALIGMLSLGSISAYADSMTVLNPETGETHTYVTPENSYVGPNNGVIQPSTSGDGLVIQMN